MVITIKKAKIPAWGYEITTKQGSWEYHNIATTLAAARLMVLTTFGPEVKIREKL